MKAKYIAPIIIGALLACGMVFRHWTQPSIALNTQVSFEEVLHRQNTGEVVKWMFPRLNVTATNQGRKSAHYLGYGPSPIITMYDIGNDEFHTQKNVVPDCGVGLGFHELSPHSVVSFSTPMTSILQLGPENSKWVRIGYTFTEGDNSCKSLLKHLGFYKATVWTDRIPLEKLKTPL